MTIDADWVSGTYLRLIFPILDEFGDALAVPGVDYPYPRGEVIDAAEWTLGHTPASSPLLQITPTRIDGSTLLVEVPSGTDLPPGLYSHQLFLSLEGKRERVKEGTIRVLGGPPTDA